MIDRRRERPPRAWTARGDRGHRDDTRLPPRRSRTRDLARRVAELEALVEALLADRNQLAAIAADAAVEAELLRDQLDAAEAWTLH